MNPKLFSAIYSIQRVPLWTEDGLSLCCLLLFLESFEQHGKSSDKKVLLQMPRLS